MKTVKYIAKQLRYALMLKALISISSYSYASWLQQTYHESYQEAEIVVVATLFDKINLEIAPNNHLHLGLLEINQVLKGYSRRGYLFLLLPSVNRPPLSTDLDYNIGEYGIWFLKNHLGPESGLYYVSHPKHFMPL